MTEYRSYFFTLAANQGGPGCIEVVASSGSHARSAMFKYHGPNWAFMYNEMSSVHELDRRVLDTIYATEDDKVAIEESHDNQ